MCYGATNIWVRRWVTFFVVLVLFIATMFGVHSQQGTLGRVIDKKTNSCLYVSGKGDGYALYRRQGAACREDDGAMVTMEEDQTDSPLLWKDPVTGEVGCIANRIDEDRVVLEVCVDDQLSQLWSSRVGHVYSTAAAARNSPKQCLAGSISILSAKRGLFMTECRNSESQLWQFEAA